jgi:hypothetical protein
MDYVSISDLPQEYLGILRQLVPKTFEKITSAIEHKRKFVHYTSASVALSIIRNKVVWMRQSSCMNDFLESHYGFDILAEYYLKNKESIRKQFNQLSPDFSTSFEEAFDLWSHDFRYSTYMACISEHQDHEDKVGRLSMWRAYGGDAGVAIVMEGSPFLRPSDALRAYTSPVHYLSRDEFTENLQKFLESIVQMKDVLAKKAKDETVALVLSMFRSMILCTKHPGFREEQEWRVIHSPRHEPSERIKIDIEIIGSTPQPVCKLPLVDVPEENLLGIQPNSLINHIIIGPTKFPFIIQDAFIRLFEEMGIEDPYKKIFVSDIPLRT